MTTSQTRYRDPSRPLEERVEDLLVRMSLDESSRNSVACEAPR
jgi:hypothetical protein